MSVKQADAVAERIKSLGLRWNGAWNGGPVSVEPTSAATVAVEGGLRITVLSPRPQELARLVEYWQEQRRKFARSSVAVAAGSEDEPREEERAAPSAAPPKIYVAGAAEDDAWVYRLRSAVESVLPPAYVHWEERDIGVAASGARAERSYPGVWRQAKRNAIDAAQLGIVFLSPAALASKVIMEDDLPALIDASATGRLALTWILVKPCDWRSTPLAPYQALNRAKRPLSELSNREAGETLARMAGNLVKLLEIAPASTPRRQRPVDTGPIDVETLAGRPFTADRDVANNASIAFLAEHHGKTVLVCGDASADVLVASVRGLASRRGVSRLRVDAFVVPHSGSAGNLNRALLEVIDCDRYLISTNGAHFGHPNRETIARILSYGRSSPDVPLTLVFNYRTPFTTVWDDPKLQERWRYRALYPPEAIGAISAGIKLQI